MGNGVSVTNRCEDDLRDWIWAELSVVYPYYFDEVLANDTHDFKCGVAWHSYRSRK